MEARPAFAARLVGVDRAITRFEAVMCVLVIGVEILAFSFWIALKGLSTPSDAREHAGLVFRAVLAATALGVLVYAVLRARPHRLRSAAAFAGALAGGALGVLSRNAGVSYFANWVNWLQDASSLTLLGGLHGVGTELTWWLAMLGASLAAGTGKHIHVDVLLRFARPRLRLLAIAFGWTFASAVCLSAVWGFFDHIAIESFGAPAQATPRAKMAIAAREGRRHLFLLQKQLGLDAVTSVHVLAGQSYDGWLYGTEWNEWVRAGRWERYFPQQDVERILLPDDGLHQLHSPLVVMPSGGNDRGLLARDLHLIFPFGLFVIGVRFLLRAVLACCNVPPPSPEHGVGGAGP